MRGVGLDGIQSRAILYVNHEHAPPIENFEESAERRVRLGLLVRQIIDDAGLVTDIARVRERVEDICSTYEESEKMVEAYMSNAQAMAQIEPMVLEEQAVEWLTEQGNISDEKVAILEMDGVTPHIYGKKQTRPFRKMGHVTIVDEDMSRARKVAQHVKETIQVKSK